MKIRMLLFVMMAIHYQGIACSCSSFNTIFCGSVNEDHYIVQAVVGDSINDYTMSVVILENIYKEILEDTIHVIGHDGGNCGQNLEVFEKGDTIIFALYGYEEYGEQKWYLNGQCDRSYLRYENGLINGEIMSDTVVNQTIEEFKDNIFNCIDLSVFTQNILAKKKIDIFPNPTSNVIHIRTAIPSISEIELIDINGKVLISEKTPNSNLHQVSLENLDQGIYVLKLISSDGIASKKIIKL